MWFDPPPRRRPHRATDRTQSYHGRVKTRIKKNKNPELIKGSNQGACKDRERPHEVVPPPAVAGIVFGESCQSRFSKPCAFIQSAARRGQAVETGWGERRRP